MLQLIVENKRLILNAMKYQNRSGAKISELDELILQYEEMTKRYERLRMLYIKQSSVESNFNGFYAPPKDKAVVSKLIETVSTLLEQEQLLIDKYIPLAEKKYVLDREYELGMPILLSENNFDILTDEKGQYYNVVFDKPVEIGDVEIYDPDCNFDAYEDILATYSCGDCVYEKGLTDCSIIKA